MTRATLARGSLLAVGLTLGLSGCSRAPELVVYVDASAGVPCEVDELLVFVDETLVFRDGGTAGPPLPAALSLVPATMGEMGRGARTIHVELRRGPSIIHRGACEVADLGTERSVCEFRFDVETRADVSPQPLDAWSPDEPSAGRACSDAGLGDAGVSDAGLMDAATCEDEVCNDRDDDCDGETDEAFDLLTDIGNCGTCGRVCDYPNGTPACDSGSCELISCEGGFYDLNDDEADGCEYACTPVGDEVCNDRDDDCDGQTDEGFDLDVDLDHCGACGRACVYASAMATCASGTCEMGACDTGFYDLNGDETDGCEYACTPVGDEVCNDRDDDCDGQTDEEFDFQTDIGNCGTCGTVCDYPNGTPACDSGSCELISCEGGFYDLNGDETDGCEYACTPVGDETCNGADDDCDGEVDEESTSALCPVYQRCRSDGTSTTSCRDRVIAYEAIGEPDLRSTVFRDACSFAVREVLHDPSESRWVPYDLTMITGDPFDFEFYGRAIRQLYVHENGIVALIPDPETTTPAVDDPPPPVTVATPPDVWDTEFTMAIMPFRESMAVPNFGLTCLGVTGSAPNRRIVITWRQLCFKPVGESCSSSLLTFSAELAESTDVISVRYDIIPFFGWGDNRTSPERSQGSEATQGVFGPGPFEEDFGAAPELRFDGVCLGSEGEEVACGYTVTSHRTQGGADGMGFLEPYDFRPIEL